MEIVKNVSDEKLLMMYNSADLFVLPSIVDSQGNTEGLGVVLLEAMACGVPVIGSDVGGISDIIKNEETGWVVREKDSMALSSVIINSIEKKSLKARLAVNGYEMINDKFSWLIIAKNYLDVYLNVR